ncbi:unnamed protein product [Ambrosiozyma monospora]|uniref:Unnamed protein product n=1 Tax=Ambrosiozyma monospora TaxID=43982 RepID=A0ACB5TSQ9_AMBMO|nr:unnamed protein product [Ambrosiozyma monospora]
MEKQGGVYPTGATGTWEDYNKTRYEHAYGFTGDRTWAHVDPNSSMYEQYQKNRTNILISLFLTTAVYTALQFAHIILYDDYIGGSHAAYLAQAQDHHDKTERDLADAYSNFNMGDTKDERINRFLWFRFLGQLLRAGDFNEMKKYLYKEKIIKDKEDSTGHSQLQKFDLSKLDEPEPVVAAVPHV